MRDGSDGGTSAAKAPHGERPGEVERSVTEALHPGLKGTGWTVTDPTPSDRYNCIGWALCSRDFGWRGDIIHDVDGPERMARAERYFVDAGWTRSADCKPKKGVRKIALYCKREKEDGREFDDPTHAAKQVVDDWWESKLGQLYRIIHLGLDAIADDSYGKPCLCFERPLKTLLEDQKKLRADLAKQRDELKKIAADAKVAVDHASAADRPQAQADYQDAQDRAARAEKAVADADRMIADLEKAIPVESH